VAVNIPNTATQQPSETQGMGESGKIGYEVSFKDLYATLKTAADAIAKGDTYTVGEGASATSRVVSGYRLSRSSGEMGVLTLTLLPQDGTGTGGTAMAQRETWSLKSVRNDVSLMAYCGISPGANPQRVDLEMWLKETDAELASAYKYRKNEDDTEGTELSEASKALADKFLKGADSVIRVYPVLTKTRIYTSCPATVYENLCRVDTPSVTEAAVVEKPGNLANIISSHSWLKVQDDLEKNADGSFSRTESWMGLPTSERTWDEDFYGSSAWPMPYAGA